jgi:nitrogen regulatory protein PII
LKAVYAYIKRSRFDDVSIALYQIPDVSGITVFDARGWGRRGEDTTEGEQYAGQLEENMKIEIVCPDELADAVSETIWKHAHTGLRGDGLVYVFTIDNYVRIGADIDNTDEADS